MIFFRSLFFNLLIDLYYIYVNLPVEIKEIYFSFANQILFLSRMKNLQKTQNKLVYQDLKNYDFAFSFFSTFLCAFLTDSEFDEIIFLHLNVIE